MKKTISILMIAMMLLTSGALSAYALVEEAAPGEPPVAEEADVAEPEAISEDAAVEDAQSDTAEAAEAEEAAEEVASEEAALAAPIMPINFKETAIDVMNATISWEPVTVEGTAEIEGFEGIVYTVKLGNEEKAKNLAETTYTFTDLKPGNYSATVEAYVVISGISSLIGSGYTNFTINDYIESVPRVSVYSGYGSVSVYWEPVQDAEKYIVVYSNTKERADISDPRAYKLDVLNNLSTVNRTAKNFKIKGYPIRIEAPWDSSVSAFKITLDNVGKTTYYKVYAVKTGADGSEIISATAPMSYGMRVTYIKYKFTLKKAKKLKSHDGYNKSYKFKKGQTLEATGFGGGKYKFYYKIGSKSYYFYCNAIDTKNNSAIYKKSGNYSKTAAENYVNEKKIKSRTNWLIWTSLYCQHTYVFKKVGGKWVLDRHFEIGSGKPKAASPSGEDKELIAGPGTEKKPGPKTYRKGHGPRYYWSPYSSWNSYHSVKMSKDKKKPLQTLGYPASLGCIRCSYADAKYIFGLPRHTKVVVL